MSNILSILQKSLSCWFSSWFNYLNPNFIVTHLFLSFLLTFFLYFTLPFGLTDYYLDFSINNNQFSIFVNRGHFIIYLFVWFIIFFFSSRFTIFSLFLLLSLYHFSISYSIVTYIENPHTFIYIIDWNINIDKTRKYEIFKEVFTRCGIFEQKDIPNIYDAFEEFYSEYGYRINISDFRYALEKCFFPDYVAPYEPSFLETVWDLRKPTLTFIIICKFASMGPKRR